MKGCVPTKGIEPSRPCERQILSLLRLPIPPHGLFLLLKTLKGLNVATLSNDFPRPQRRFNRAAILRHPAILSKIRCKYFFL